MKVDTGGDSPRRREDDILYDSLSLIIDSLDNLHGLDQHEFLGHAFEAAFGLIPEAQKGSLYELQGDRYRPVFARGYDFEVLSRISFGLEDAFIDFGIDEAAPIQAYETRIEGRDEASFPPETIEVFKALGTYSGFNSLYSPIRVDGINRGLISLEKFGEGNFSRLSHKVLQYYARLISEFYAQRLYQERQTQLYKDIVTALVSAIDVMDSYTEGHGRRVSIYSQLIARELELEPQEIEDIGTAALLHDIGKLGIPSEVLRKPGKLSAEEYAIVKQHPEHSARILRSIHGFEHIVELALRHHECYDSSGYPGGLCGGAIPIGAQIIQLADSFDAMTSTRSYRPALSRGQALDELRSHSGTQFHPAVVAAALSSFME